MDRRGGRGLCVFGGAAESGKDDIRNFSLVFFLPSFNSDSILLDAKGIQLKDE